MKKMIKDDCVNASSYLNGYSPFIPWSNAIGFKPNILKYIERHQSALLAEEYLLNSYHTRHDHEMQLSAELFYEDSGLFMRSMLNKRDCNGLPRIELPEGVPLNLNLGSAILQRRSIRQFTGDIIPLPYIATLLRAAGGISNTATARLRDSDDTCELNFCSVSSAGHLYPVDIYLGILNVKGLAKGVYHYSAQEDALFKTGDDYQLAEIIDSFVTSENFYSHFKANYITLFVAHPWKSMCKYGNRGLRFTLHEVGAISQNMHLANISLGLGSLDWGSYYENEVNQVLGFDGVNQSVLHILLAGMVG